MPAPSLVDSTKVVQNDPTKPTTINFVGQSPHVFVYRFWTRAPDAEAWTKVRDGDTVDQVPDVFTIPPSADGTRVAHWVGVSGKPRSAFRFSVVFTQDGQVPVGGVDVHDDVTDAKGAAVVEHEVLFV